MTNFYVEQAKNTMRDFLVKEKTRAEEIKRNDGYYSVEMARTKNAEIVNQSENDYLTTINAINDIFKNVKRKVALTSFPNSVDITDDIKLFDGTFPLSQKEIEIFIDKYSTNETMLRIIGKYGTEKEPLECVCANNHRFMVTPLALKRDPFCPVCKGKKLFIFIKH